VHLRQSLPLLVVLGILSRSVAASAQEPEPAKAPDAPPPAPGVTPPPAPASTSPATVPPTQGEVEARRVLTTVDSGAEKNAVIERRVETEESSGRLLFVLPFRSNNEKWEQVCVAPCKVHLDRYSTYRVARANDMPSTHPFTLPPGADQLQLQVEPGKLLAHRISSRLIALGIAGAVVGGVLVTLASKFEEEKDVRVAGIITGGAGLVTLGIGIPLALLTQTHIKAGEKKLAGEPGKPPKPRLTVQGLVF
jgi:hypothetical protein